jgi:hypothetical protein
MKSFLAVITPVHSGGHPDQGLPDTSPGTPSHPIVIPPAALPGHPSHPIVLPPGLPVRPDNGLPEEPEDGTPSHPIVLPPGMPDQGLPATPGVPGLKPEHPIVLPPTPPNGAIIIPLPDAPNQDLPGSVPPGSKSAILWYGPGTYPQLVYVTPKAMPK